MVRSRQQVKNPSLCPAKEACLWMLDQGFRYPVSGSCFTATKVCQSMIYKLQVIRITDIPYPVLTSREGGVATVW